MPPLDPTVSPPWRTKTLGGWLDAGSTSCVVTREFVSLQGEVRTACASEAKEFTSNRQAESRRKGLHQHRV